MSIATAIVVTEDLADRIRIASGRNGVDFVAIENILLAYPTRSRCRAALAARLEGCGVSYGLTHDLSRMIEHVWHYGRHDWGSPGAVAALYLADPDRVRRIRAYGERFLSDPDWGVEGLGRALSRVPWLCSTSQSSALRRKMMLLLTSC